MAASCSSSSTRETISLSTTDRVGCEGIHRDKKIYDERKLRGIATEASRKRKQIDRCPTLKRKRGRRSSGSIYGYGVYLTDKCPLQASNRQIAEKIWFGGIPEQMLEDGRVKYVFAFDIMKDQVEHPDPEHNIWIYRNDTLDLKDKNLVRSWKVYEVQECHVREFTEAVEVTRLVPDEPRTAKRTRTK